MGRCLQATLSPLKPLILHPARFGALTEIFVSLSPLIVADRNGSYIILWGRLGTMATHITHVIDQRDTGPKLWSILEKEVQQFLI